ncbi:bleomycin resistance protein [Shewanella xiamenensis]|uniref:bleomycin resistance protein n=1 Tax=Shewanella xiamenensis TaxID=332186 RepID=UPI000A7A786C|nr:VOC family protein [Shewanella xiamenensis]
MASSDIFPPLTPELNVRSIEDSLNFYTKILGFTICFERPEDGFATIELDGAVLMLEQVENLNPSNDPWVTAKLEYPFGRGINFQITVLDIDGIHNRLTRHGYPIQLPLEQKSYRAGNEFINVRQFMVIDPDGYLLRFNTLTSESNVGAQV